MYNLIPEVKHLAEGKGEPYFFSRILFDLSGLKEGKVKKLCRKIVPMKFWDLPSITISFNDVKAEAGLLSVTLNEGWRDISIPEAADAEALKSNGYSLESGNGNVDIRFSTEESLSDALSTLKQLAIRRAGTFSMPMATIFDFPSLEVRSLSTTFAWYAGYGRIGFDSQLWGFEEWKEFVNICSDYKINQLNMCMYGYWPFDFPEYPETCLKDVPMKIWNRESRNELEILYTHPNLSREFLSELIEYAHLLSIRIFAYVGLNSYNGGYSNIHRGKRMKLPEGSKFVNDFDSLCLSDPENIKYLEKSLSRIVQLGFDGIVFEESEEAYWFCNCDSCGKKYGEKTASPAEAKHEANYDLLKKLHKVIKRENPDCEVGLRAWREPPLEKSVEYLKHCKKSIPEDVCLYWAPGLYVPESEFKKWIDVFGAERICGRDTESNAWSATQGRLLRIFKSNVLRSGEETNDQFIEKDIDQHRGAVSLRVRGINGYLFEWYGYFIHLLAHAYYGWGAQIDPEEFYRRAVYRIFGKVTGKDVLYVLQNILTIHESQLSLFPAEFPFLRNNVSEHDVAAINAAIEKWPDINGKIESIIAACESREELNRFAKHFYKIRGAHQRNHHIYKLCLAAVAYDKEKSEDERLRLLRDIENYNEMDFEVVRNMFFDIYPVDRTGVKSCMYPYHELKRVLDNKLGRNSPTQDQMIYLGVEALGWLWI